MFITKYQKFIIFSLLIFFSLFMIAQVVSAAIYDPANPVGTSGLQDTATKAKLPTNDVDPSALIGRVVGYALSFLGVAFFVLIIYAGYLWMFSMGNEQTVTKAKEIIIAAVIGLIIVLMAYAITSYIGEVLQQKSSNSNTQQPTTP